MELPLIIDLETKRVLNAEYSGAKQATNSNSNQATHSGKLALHGPGGLMCYT